MKTIELYEKLNDLYYLLIGYNYGLTGHQADRILSLVVSDFVNGGSKVHTLSVGESDRQIEFSLVDVENALALLNYRTTENAPKPPKHATLSADLMRALLEAEIERSTEETP